ncbi:hypothetical protein [Streptomyces sp. NPDC048436]|uniref:hypothetical protein n=1 Tax=Streptomyces sp. NPDC048436 TaxID=3365550 RepID=UPI0037168B28
MRDDHRLTRGQVIAVPMALLWIPDVGWGLVVGIGLALLLAVERTALAVLDLRRQP